MMDKLISQLVEYLGDKLDRLEDRDGQAFYKEIMMDNLFDRLVNLKELEGLEYDYEKGQLRRIIGSSFANYDTRHIFESLILNGQDNITLGTIEYVGGPQRDDPYDLISVEAVGTLHRIDDLITQGWSFLLDITTDYDEYTCYTAYIAAPDLALDYRETYELRYDAMANRAMYLPIELSMWDWLERHAKDPRLLQIWQGVY